MLENELINAYSPWDEFSKAKLEIYKVVMLSEDTHLPRGIKEMIAVIIAKAYDCNFCLEHHFNSMKEYGISYDLASEIRQDYKSSSLDEKMKALLVFCEKFTASSSKITDNDYKDLMGYGWSEDEIFESIIRLISKVGIIIRATRA